MSDYRTLPKDDLHEQVKSKCATTCVVILTDSELCQCCLQAMTRMLVSRLARRNQSMSVKRAWFEHFKHELVGVIAEVGYCKWRGIYPSREIDTFHSVPDALDGAEIRSISSRGHCLIVRDDDPKDRPYVLVSVDRDARCEMLGWILGKDAMRPEWIRDPGGNRPSWFVPQEALHNMETPYGR